MTLYDRIYNRGVAGAVGLVCMVALVLTQLTIVAEAVASLRPGWAPWQAWGAAVGFEAGTFAIGLIGAVSGFGWWQGLALAGFVFVSTFFGFDGSMQAQLNSPHYLWADLQAADPLQILRAIIEGSFQALMYVGVVFSVHRLFAKGEPTTVPVRLKMPKRGEPFTAPEVLYGYEGGRQVWPPSPDAAAAALVQGLSVQQAAENVARATRRRPPASGPDWPAIVGAVRQDGRVSLAELTERHGNGVARSTILRNLHRHGITRDGDRWVQLDGPADAG